MRAGDRVLDPAAAPSISAQAEALTARAKHAAAQGRVSEAEQVLRRAVAVAPAFVPAYIDLASMLCEQARTDEALVLLDEVLAARPRSPWALSLKAAVLETDRRTSEALAVHEALVAQAPGAPVPWLNYGHALAASARTGDAIAAYRRALTLDPGNGFAWWGLANLRTVRLSAEDVVAMECALPRTADGIGRAQLHFALGKALGDVGRFEASFRHYEQANRIRGGLAPYDAAETGDRVRRTRATFAPEFLASRAGQGCQATDPIFIVGMPRSGSTLVEQILASHPLIEGAGELAEMDRLAAYIGGQAGQDWPEAVARLDAAGLQALGERYLAGASRFRRTARPFFTDKMPSNWRYLGLIHLILPNARIIDVRRDPMACCFSAFATYFNRGTRVPTTLEDLGRHYRACADLVDDFAAALPGRIHRLRYERLVADPEGEVRRLLSYLGLPFDAACLRFHENPRAIHTPSAQQVRRPINGQGLDRWRGYAPWLAPLKRGLDRDERPGGIARPDFNHLSSSGQCRDQGASFPGEIA